ncbi:MAG: peptidase M23, partial [Bacillati bacterium ANGP1]
RAQEHLTARRRVLGSRLRDIYKYGRTGYAEVLLGSDDFAAFVTRWQLISTIVHADTEALDAHAADMARYQRLQATLVQDQAYLRTLTAHTQARQREIVATELAKREMLERLQVERAAYERVVRELEKNSKDLEAMIRKAQVPPRRPTMAEAHTRFAFLWPTRGLFTSGFGMRRHPLFGIWHLHTGVDIATAWGAPVLAAAEGRVIYAGWFGGYGKIVVIDHGEGMSTLYGHLSSLLVVAGDEVRRGQPVGRVGSTGFSTGPHLHFEVRVNGRPINPTSL